MKEHHKQIVFDDANFFSQLIKFVENIARFVEEEKSGLTGVQKFSRFMYFFKLLYKTTSLFIEFPGYVKNIMDKLPEIVEFTVQMLHFAGIFQHKTQEV